MVLVMYKKPPFKDLPYREGFNFLQQMFLYRKLATGQKFSTSISGEMNASFYQFSGVNPELNEVNFPGESLNFSS